MLDIRIQHGGQRILLPVLILPPSDAGQNFRMAQGMGLFDTGASKTAIAPRFVKELDLQWRGKRNIVTVRGDEVANQYHFRFGFLSVADDPLSRSEPFILPSDLYGIDFTPTSAFDVLIGMDVISQGDCSLSRSGEFSYTI